MFVENYYPPPKEDESLSTLFSIVGAVIGVGAAVGGPAAPGFGVLGSLFGVFSDQVKASQEADETELSRTSELGQYVTYVPLVIPYRAP